MLDQDRLLDAAREAAGRAYAPYSSFRVGAAVLCEGGDVVTGVNVENRSYGLTICAERSAVTAAVSAGHRSFVAIAIVGIDSHDPLPPCGACRQVIGEFFGSDAQVLFAGSQGDHTTSSVGDLLPYDSLHELRRP